MHPQLLPAIWHLHALAPSFLIPVLNQDQQSTVLSREHAPGVYGASSPPVNFNYKREEPMQLEPLCFSDKAQLLVSLWFSDLREWRRLTRRVISQRC